MTRTAAQRYLVESWRGLECVRWSRVTVRGVRARVDSAIVDDNADRIYIRADGPVVGLMADWTPGRGWHRIDDPVLVTVLLDQDGGRMP